MTDIGFTSTYSGMGLLSEIQGALMDGQELGPVLLKLRFLASRLGSESLQEWVQHESQGYRHGIEVPDYRELSVNYQGTFNGPFGSAINNAPIPPYLIMQLAGEEWLSHRERQSISAIESLLLGGDNNSSFYTSASNLILLLQNNIYKGYACNSVTGIISRASLVQVLSTVRSRVLDLTIEIEKAVPAAQDIKAGWTLNKTEPKESAIVNNITNQIITGTVGANAASSGSGAQIRVKQGDVSGLAKALTDAGIAKEDADELAQIVASEKPISAEEPFGPSAQSWIAKNIGKTTTGVWKIGLGVATQVIAAIVKQHYGLH